MRIFFKSAMRSRIVWTFAITSLLFVALWELTSDTFALVFANSIMFAAITGLSYIFSVSLIKIIRDNKPDRVDHLIVALCGIVGSTLFIRGWTSYYLIAERPKWMFQHPVFSYVLTIGAVATLWAIYFFEADPTVPVNRRLRLVSIFIVFGIMVCLMTWWFDLFQLLPNLF